MDAALEIGALDEGYTELAPAVAGADLVILCTPVGLFRSLLTEIAPLLSAGTLVTDVGSTKRTIVSAAGELLPENVSFVGSHPMAGSEKRGVQYARADLYDGAMCILTPTAETPVSAIERVERFWTTLGMRTCRLSPEDHDRRLADISHLPHALAAALVRMQQEDSARLAGKGFLDMTRIASGDGGLWRDIFVDNRDNVCQSIRTLKGELDSLLKLIEADDGGEALRRWLDTTAERRQRMRHETQPLASANIGKA